ncbi:MAG: hypothetical protein QOD75_301 [Blastocatellia bacterium]|jgi:tetratricopeptide (TPR) repeat protein|nr:hypothetical protein [Blastocatellia bacterium]
MASKIIMRVFFSALLFLIAINASVAIARLPAHQRFVIQSTTESGDLAEANRLSALVVKLVKEGRYDEAKSSAAKALAIRERILGPEHEYVADSLINLSEVYIAQRQYVEAEASLHRLLRITEKKFGADSLRTGKALDRLGLTQFWSKRFPEAEKSLNRALAIKEKILSPNDAELAPTILALAEFHTKRSTHQQAAPFYLRAIAIWEKTLAPTDPNLLTVVDRYICYLEGSEQRKELESFLSGRRAYKVGDLTLADGAPYGGVRFRQFPAYSLANGTYITFDREVLRVLVDHTGKVIKAETLCRVVPDFGKELVQPSLDAAVKEKFPITLDKGVPTKSSFIIIYRYGSIRPDL